MSAGRDGPELAPRRPMMRWTATLVSAVVIVFSATFIATRLSAGTASATPQLRTASILAGKPLRVRTLRGVAPLPRLHRVQTSAASPVPVAPLSTPPPPPQASSSTRPPAEALCARAAWLQFAGGAPALPRTGRC